MVQSHYGSKGRGRSSGPRFSLQEPATSAGKSSGTRRRRWSAVAAVGAVVAGSLGAFAAPASAALSAVGPIDPATHFPAYYTDTNGLSLALCLGPNCLTDTNFVADHEAGLDAEAFYYSADAATAKFSLHLALEAAYADDGPGQEVVFQRTQVTARSGGLVANATYNVTDPYGSYTCKADAGGFIVQNACRTETNPVPENFTNALGGRQNPFLTPDPTEPAPPAGFIGNAVNETKVVGSPTGFNGFRVVGPGLVGTCAGGTIPNCQETDQFVLEGKIADTGVPSASVSQGTLDFGDVPTTPALTKSLTYANTGTLPVTIGSIGVGGPNASAFTQTNNCPATLAAGATCTIQVTFTPQPGQSSAATLTITDDTPAATRNVTLQGSNLGVMFVSDPAPPASLAFGTVPVGTTSAEDNAVIGNSGNGPLTISKVEIIGTSAALFKPGPNDTCMGAGVTVAPDGGCEIGVQFVPSTTTGSKSATLRVTDSNGNVVTIPLTGTAGPAGPTDTTRPTAAVAPAGGATGVAVGTDVTAAFSEPVTGVSGATFSLRVQGSTTDVSASVTYDAAAQTATLNPTANLTAGTTYTASLTSGIQDLASPANTLVARQWSFTTVNAPVNTPPTVTARAPLPNATSVRVTANISATFSEVVQGVSGETFQVTNPAGGVVGATLTNPTAQRWLLNPTGNLAANTVYTVTLTGGPTAIRDLAGAPLETTSWTFTTAAATNVAPSVTGRTPAPNATSVARGINVSARFSEAVTGVSTTTFALRLASATPASTPITATVTNVAGTNRWVLNPSARLLANRQYRVTLTGGTDAIRDLAGAPLANSPVLWTFTTGA